MILHGNQRGSGADLARHLLEAENEHIELHAFRGFIARSLQGAFQEAYAHSLGTRCRQYLFSLSLSPPPQEKVSVEAFESAITRIEDKLGLSACARVIVFHEKQGRRHAHAVWSRIDPETMKAVPLSFSKMKLREVSRELFMEHGWTMPKGLCDSRLKDQANYTLAEWQQAKRKGRDPKEVKSVLKEAWAISDSKSAFEQALGERGFKLAQGERRGFLAVDHLGEAFAIPRWTEQKTKDVRARLGPEDQLQTIEEAKAAFARELLPHVQKLRTEELARQKQERERHEERVSAMTRIHEDERAALKDGQSKRERLEMQERAARLRGGILGLWERVSGQRRRTIERNEMEALASYQRDREERDALIFRQLEARRALELERQATLTRNAALSRELREDVSRLRGDAQRINASKQGSALGSERPAPTKAQEEKLNALRARGGAKGARPPRQAQRGRDLEM